MEHWFWFAVLSAVTSGFGGFTNKIAAYRKLDAGLMLVYSGIMSLSVVIPLALFTGVEKLSWTLFLIAFTGGLIAATAGIFKIRALENIDTTIFYPLFKLLSPLATVIFGMLLFAESFSTREWIGILLSLFVPLLLITKLEHVRQTNLIRGLWYVLLASITAAIVAVVNKYSIDVFQALFWIMASSTTGVFVGGLISFLWKNRKENIKEKMIERTHRSIMMVSLLRAATLSLSFLFTLYALSHGGPLGIVYTIQSLYILIPIVLSIMIYDEHWNTQKVVAIVLSILALGLLK